MLQVVSARSLLNIKDHSRFSWVYIGSYRGLAFASRCLAEGKRIFIGRTLEEITEAVRDRFVDYVGATAAIQCDRVLWYSSRMASKSGSQTAVFDHYVYLKLLEKLSSHEGNDILVVTDDDDLLEIVRRSDFRDVCLIGVLDPLMYVAREHLKGWVHIVRLFLLWLLSKAMPRESLDNYDVIIPSWIDRRTFNNLPEFHDPYLGDLGAWLRKKGFIIGRVAPLVVPLRFMGALREHFKAIFYPLQNVSLTDLWKTFWSALNAEIPEDPGVDGRMIHMLLVHEVRQENRTKAYFSNLLLFYGYRRLFTRLKDSATVIYPFENQPWEKMLLLALPEHIKKIGYAHAAIPYNWLDYRVSRLERSAPVPSVILTIGQRWADFLRQYYPDVPVEVAGAIRYEYLMKREKGKMPDAAGRTVVAALPINPLIALSLQYRLLALAEQGGLNGLTLKVKPHPYLPADALLVKPFLKYANCSFVKEDICDLLAGCNVLITSASTVAYESLAMGVRTLIYVPEAVSWGIEHFIKEDVILAYEDNFSEKFFEAVGSVGHSHWNAAEYFRRPDFSIFLRHFTAKELK